MPPAWPPGWPAESMPPQVLIGSVRFAITVRQNFAMSLSGIMPRSLSCASTMVG